MPKSKFTSVRKINKQEKKNYLQLKKAAAFLLDYVDSRNDAMSQSTLFTWFWQHGQSSQGAEKTQKLDITKLEYQNILMKHKTEQLIKEDKKNNTNEEGKISVYITYNPLIVIPRNQWSKKRKRRSIKTMPIRKSLIKHVIQSNSTHHSTICLYVYN